MSDVVKIILVWIGIPVIGVVISCILGWLATKIHESISNCPAIIEADEENK